MESKFARLRNYSHHDMYNNMTLKGDPLMCDTTQEFHVVVNIVTILIGLMIILGLFYKNIDYQ